MKKILIKYGGCLLAAAIIFVTVLKLVDLHTDGILIRDADYYIKPLGNVTYQLDVIDAVEMNGVPVRLYRAADGANQSFAIQYVRDDVYAIKYGKNNDMCIAVASDKESVVTQGYNEENEYNLWNIERIGTSQAYKFTNVATQNSMYYKHSEELNMDLLVVGDYEEADELFRFKITK